MRIKTAFATFLSLFLVGAVLIGAVHVSRLGFMLNQGEKVIAPADSTVYLDFEEALFSFKPYELIGIEEEKRIVALGSADAVESVYAQVDAALQKTGWQPISFQNGALGDDCKASISSYEHAAFEKGCVRGVSSALVTIQATAGDTSVLIQLF